MNANPSEIFMNPIQIGIIVRDLEKALVNFQEVLGMDNFRVASFPPEIKPDAIREYKGREGNFKAKFCFYDWGNIEFEMIQPLEGESIWADFLDAKGEMGLHHIKFAVDHHAPVHSHFNNLGIPIIQKGEGVGPNAGREWVFYDTFDRLGFDIEMINRIRKE